LYRHDHLETEAMEVVQMEEINTNIKKKEEINPTQL
jgi:hypothetical protein